MTVVYLFKSDVVKNQCYNNLLRHHLTFVLCNVITVFQLLYVQNFFIKDCG